MRRRASSLSGSASAGRAGDAPLSASSSTTRGPWGASTDYLPGQLSRAGCIWRTVYPVRECALRRGGALVDREGAGRGAVLRFTACLVRPVGRERAESDRHCAERSVSPEAARAGRPHREFPFRSATEQEFKVTDVRGTPLGTLSLSQALREGYPGAVYYYMARPYRVFGSTTERAKSR